MVCENGQNSNPFAGFAFSVSGNLEKRINGRENGLFKAASRIRDNYPNDFLFLLCQTKKRLRFIETLLYIRPQQIMPRYV